MKHLQARTNDTLVRIGSGPIQEPATARHHGDEKHATNANAQPPAKQLLLDDVTMELAEDH